MGHDYRAVAPRTGQRRSDVPDGANYYNCVQTPVGILTTYHVLAFWFGVIALLVLAWPLLALLVRRVRHTAWVRLQSAFGVLVTHEERPTRTAWSAAARIGVGGRSCARARRTLTANSGRCRGITTAVA